MTVYIYALTDPRYGMFDKDYYEDEVRYVGKSRDPIKRYKSHLRDPRRNRKCCWIRKLLRLELKPDLVILQECDDNNWQYAEMYWIAHYKELGHDLTNSTNGGEEQTQYTERARKNMSKAQKKRFEDLQERIKCFGQNIGRKHSLEVRKRMGDGHRGCKQSEETKHKQSIVKLGNKNPLGCKRSDETKQKLRDQKIGLKNPRCKFSVEDILEIRELAKPTKFGKGGRVSKRVMSLKDIAKKFGVCPGTIEVVIYGYRYADVQ